MMKYDVTVFDYWKRNLKLERALKQCRVPFTCTPLERWDCCGRAPVVEGYEIHFSTNSKRVLEFLGFSARAITQIALATRKPFRTPYRLKAARLNEQEIQGFYLPF